MSQPMPGPRIFFSVGEPSGDLHGANLIQRLYHDRPTAEIRGFGGPRMEAAGMRLLTDLTQLAVMGFSQVLRHVFRFTGLLRMAARELDAFRPDAVVLIDFPGFNWWIARLAKRRGIPVFYYGVPQLWAWAPWRIRKMRRLVDHVLCKLPFEAEWYRRHGCQARFLGHPYFDELATRQLDQETVRHLAEREGRLVGILPGSRRQEVLRNLPAFLVTAARIAEQVPGTRFAVASYNEAQAELARQLLDGTRLPIEVVVGRTAEVLSASHCCLACSGSVSLELLYHARPAVIYYRVRPLLYFLARWFLVTVRYVTLVNLLACEDRFEPGKGPYDPDSPRDRHVPYPEYPTWRDCSQQMARHCVTWLEDADELERCVRQLQALRDQLGQRGATDRAAEFILSQLDVAAPRTGPPPLTKSAALVAR